MIRGTAEDNDWDSDFDMGDIDLKKLILEKTVVEEGYKNNSIDSWNGSTKNSRTIDLYFDHNQVLEYDKKYNNELKHFAYGYPDWTHQYHHAGFDIVANRIIEILGEYMDENHDMNRDICFWVTGHSMGGGVANLVAAELLHGTSGINNKTDNVYCYTFASPNTFYLTDNTYTRPNRVYHDEIVTESYREPHSSKYRCIFNVVNADDFVPEVPMRDCGWTKYGRTTTISFNSNKKQIEHIIKSEDKYNLLHYNWTNTNKFINETYKGNTQTIRNIVKSFNSIFEEDPKNIRHNAYKINPNDYVYMHFSDLTVPKNVKPYQKIDTMGEENIQYQMPAYFMQYLSFAMKTDLNILGIDIPHPEFINLLVHGGGFWIARFSRVSTTNTQNSIVDNKPYIETPHFLESYYYITKTISGIDFQ